MATIYSQDWSGGNSTFTSVSPYDRGTDGPDALYPDVAGAEANTVSASTLVWDGVNGDWQSTGVWFQGMGSLAGGGTGDYAAGSGFWDGTTGRITARYTPTTASLADFAPSGLAPLIQIMTPTAIGGFGGGFEGAELLIGWDFATPGLLVMYNSFGGGITSDYAAAPPTPADGVPYEVTVAWKCGTPSGGFSSVASDGYLRVYVNGTQVHEVTALDLFLDFNSNPGNLISGAAFGYFGLLGPLSQLTIQDVDVVQMIGSAAIGYKPTVTAPYAVNFSLDGAANTLATPNTLKVFGDVEVDGDLAASVGSSMSSKLDGLGT